MVKRLLFVGVGVLCLSATLPAQTGKVKVQIIGSRATASDAVYVVPGFKGTNCTAMVPDAMSPDCVVVAGHPDTYATYVDGVALSLQLPDGRVAVVSCADKYNWSDNTSLYRSCRIPCGDVTAEFKGEDAKLEWVVPYGLDGSRKQDEKYKVVAVLTKSK